MNPGLGTSEASWQGPMAPTVICRDCRAKLSVEESEDHDCSNPITPPSPTKAILIKTAARASSFIDSLKADVNTLTHKSDQASLTQASSSTQGFQKLEDIDLGGLHVKHRAASVSEIRSAVSTLELKPMPTELQRRWSTEYSGIHNALFQCNVCDVRVTTNQIAVYSLVTRIPSLTVSDITVERRFREFYVFAQHIYAIFPSTEVWQRLPPKTYCTFRRQNTLSDGFLLRRRNGLEDFLRCAIDKMMLGGEAQATIAQWYLLRLFLNLPSRAPIAAPTDRSLTAAMHELKKHARQFSGWIVSRKPAECDTVFEKVADNFLMVKRVVTCHFPARAVFDMVMNRSIDAEASESGAGMAWAPFVESEEVLSRENENTWTVRTIFTGGGWSCGRLQIISLKTWRVDESGTIAIVMIPADAAAWNDPRVVDSGLDSRVDCILGGWLITPTPWEGSCSVTWFMQANFGQCDSRAEFTGCQSRFTSFLARRCLHLWADEVVHLTQALGQVYDAEHYRQLGPLTTGAKSQEVTSPRST